MNSNESRCIPCNTAYESDCLLMDLTSSCEARISPENKPICYNISASKLQSLFNMSHCQNNNESQIMITSRDNSSSFSTNKSIPRAITVTLQYGSRNETIFLEGTSDQETINFLHLKGREMVNCDNGVSSEAPAKASTREILLYLHDYHRETTLRHLTAMSQLENGSVIEIIRVDRGGNDRPIRPHSLELNNYISPTFCDYCGEILVGLIKQGLQCNLCKCNFHKRCAFAPRNDCAKAEGSMKTDKLIPDSSAVSNNSALQFQLPHTLSFHNYKTPTVCKVCDKMLLGFVKQGLRCRDCKINVHKKCAAMLPMNCQVISEDGVTPYFDHESNNEKIIEQNLSKNDAKFLQLTGNAEDKILAPCSSNDMIPLARLPGSAAIRLARPGPLFQGWLIHFVIYPFQNSKSKVITEYRRLRHYWILSPDAISLYNEYNDGVNPNRVYKRINLAEIIALMTYHGPPLNQDYPAHYFEIQTVENIVYCVGENLDSLSNTNSRKYTMTSNQCGSSNITTCQAWFQALQQALQPPVLRTDPENVEPAVQFTQLYQIFRDKVLGSGQFGTVYFGVHRLNKKEVAIKVIAKDRFSKRTNSGVETLKSEVAILRSIDHHGIIKLENMFETKDKIFVVMEKMNGDMLEMILSQANGRLDERCTKFLLVQILSALRYLHNRGIAHCDLKPENVLLSDFDTNFPQTKLCDFGYARFIDDMQFRRTIVGTPAYLAPEVLKRKGYNKSLDMWSVGVIIYVTLSGTFPFNDGEEISDQIYNASFMFPSDIWENVSKDVIDLIQKLLRVEIEERLTIDECIAHSWLQDKQVYCDLKDLENRLKLSQYLTSERDYQSN